MAVAVTGLDLWLALKTALTAANGDGTTYTFALDSDNVKLGRVAIPGGLRPLPLVVCPGADGTSRVDADIVQTGRYYQRWVFPFAAFVGCTDKSSQDHVERAWKLLNDMTTAITSDRTLGGDAFDVEIPEFAVEDGAPIGAPGVGVCTLTVVVTFSTDGGV